MGFRVRAVQSLVPTHRWYGVRDSSRGSVSGASGSTEDSVLCISAPCDLHQRMWWASKVMRTSRVASVLLYSVFSLSVK